MSLSLPPSFSVDNELLLKYFFKRINSKGEGYEREKADIN